MDNNKKVIPSLPAPPQADSSEPTTNNIIVDSSSEDDYEDIKPKSGESNSNRRTYEDDDDEYIDHSMSYITALHKPSDDSSSSITKATTSSTSSKPEKKSTVLATTNELESSSFSSSSVFDKPAKDISSEEEEITIAPKDGDDDDNSSNDDGGNIYRQSDLERKQKMNSFMLTLTFLTSVCGFLFGYDTGYISGALVVISDSNDLNRPNGILTSGNKEFITSATSLGALLFAIVGGVLADQFGRKIVVSFGNVLFIAGALIQVFANNLWTMIAGRFVMGLGVGLASLIAPLYISEMAPSRFRGRLVIINVLAITGGQLVAYALSVGLVKIDKYGWRILVGLSCVPAIIQMVLFLFYMPETPRYLVIQNKIEEARKGLRKVYGGSDEDEIEKKLQELILHHRKEEQEINNSRMKARRAKRMMKQKNRVTAAGGARGDHSVDNDSFDDNDSDSMENATWRQRLSEWWFRTWLPFYELHTVPSNFRALVITCGLQGIQQFSGFNSLMYFSGTIFQSVGFKNPILTSLIVSGTNFVFTMVAFCIIDKVGRRKILLCTIWGMAAALVVNAVAFHYVDFVHDVGQGGHENEGNQQSAWSKIILVAMLVYVAFYALGIGNIPWQQGEMFGSTRTRSAGSCLATTTNWSGSLVISSTFLTMLKQMTPTGTFAFFAGLCVCGQVFVYFLYPETAGLNLEQVQGLLKDGFNVKESVRLNKERMKNDKQV